MAPLIALLSLAALAAGSCAAASKPSKAVSRPKSVTKETVMTSYRNLHDYKNPDGRVPNGVDKGPEDDDSPALKAALAAGPGVVMIDAGTYRLGEITVPGGVTLMGTGRATLIKLPMGKGRVFVQTRANDWKLRDMRLDGGADPARFRERVDKGVNGVVISGCTGFEVSGVIADNFNGAGFTIDHTAASAYCIVATCANIFNLAASGNHTGIRFDTRSEYMNASMLTCQGNVIGCMIHGGNVKVANSNFTNNLTGMIIEDHDNGSHGAISNCLINHNELALLAKNVKNGMAIDNCCIFYGGVRIEDSVGVSVTNGIVGSCGARVTGGAANRFAGNYIIDDGVSKFEFSPSAIVQDNYTATGLWKLNR